MTIIWRRAPNAGTHPQLSSGANRHATSRTKTGRT